MSLSDALSANNIKSALIVDDVCDVIPTAADLGTAIDDWSNFNADLQPEQRARIAEKCPATAQMRFDEQINDDRYVAAVWELRVELGILAEPVFAGYIQDQVGDDRYVQLAKSKLEALGLACTTIGREFEAAAASADIILIDLFFSKAQNPHAMDESKERLKAALHRRKANPPLVILMSRSPRLEAKREEFRDDVGLLDSAFRIIRKADLEETDRLEVQLERLAENSADSQNLAQFFAALEAGVTTAADRTLRLLRKLRLSDVGQIQQLLLSAEGEPTGSYLVDVFDRVLQHEIEGESGIIDAAIALNGFAVVNHPPPYLAGSPDLQELVQKLLSQNDQRLRLPGSLDALVTFGDVLLLPAGTKADDVKATLMVDVVDDTALLVLTPVCDLQRNGAPRILLLVGSVRSLAARDWEYGEDARSPALKIDGELRWIKWNLKHIDTVSHQQLDEALKGNSLRIGTRLREAHALELQQRVLSGLGRVGLVATLPATFPVDVEAYYAGLDEKPSRLDIAALNDGAVCFVGRDAGGKQAIRLVLTEGGGDGVIDAIAAISENDVAEKARTAFNHITASADLRKMLTSGIDLKSVTSTGWTHIQSETGQAAGVPKMGLLAWNYQIPDEVLAKSDLNKAGIILLVKDALSELAPGLEDVIRNKLTVENEMEAGAET